ncbi:MAG: hypothetical protein ACLFPP_12310 [Spirochaetaceae bacterium]
MDDLENVPTEELLPAVAVLFDYLVNKENLAGRVELVDELRKMLSGGKNRLCRKRLGCPTPGKVLRYGGGLLLMMPLQKNLEEITEELAPLSVSS